MRASGVGRSLGASRSLEQCVCCGRQLPREAIAHIGRKPLTLKSGRVVHRAFCGECYFSGRYIRDEWAVQ